MAPSQAALEAAGQAALSRGEGEQEGGREEGRLDLFAFPLGGVCVPGGVDGAGSGALGLEL